MALDNTNILNKPMFNTSEDLTALLAIFSFSNEPTLGLNQN